MLEGLWVNLSVTQTFRFGNVPNSSPIGQMWLKKLNLLNGCKWKRVLEFFHFGNIPIARKNKTATYYRYYRQSVRRLSGDENF